MKKIILASTSPRRKDLLRQVLGKNFKIVSSSYEEDNTLKFSPKKLALIHSHGKAEAVARKLSEGVVIGSDTFVWYEGFLGKPHNIANATKMLRRISGKVVKVYSGVTVIDAKSGKEFSEVEITRVKMKKLSNKEISNYIKADNPLDVAGAFRIQGLGVLLIEKINGCYTNVVGLPLPLLQKLLNKLGVKLF